MCFVIYSDCNKTEFSFSSVRASVRQHFLFMLIYSLTFIAEVLIIILVVGVSSPGYVGFDSSVTLHQYKIYWLDAIRNYLKYFLYFMIPAGLIIITFIKSWRLLLKEFFIACLIMFPQIILYCKTGLEERYILPWSFGFAYFLYYQFVSCHNLKGFENFYIVESYLYFYYFTLKFL